MRKNGFTLIELLAVIVILAIIALIATPIILGIINDAREESNERSVELYASAVRNGIAAYQLREGKEVLPGTYNETNKLPFEPEYDGKVDCENVIISETGKVSLEGCTVNNGTKKYSYGIEEESTVAKVCTIERQDASKYSVGDVVTCNIGETQDKFYVIADSELSATTIQMLTEKNIHTTEYRQSDDAGLIAFSTTNYWSSAAYVYGDYKDAEGNQQNLIYPVVYNYVSYLNTKLTTVIGNLIDSSVLEDLGCVFGASESDGCESAPSWVYSTGYWTGNQDSSIYDQIIFVGNGSDFYSSPYDPSIVGYGMTFGVRPVITISTSDIQ